MKNELNINNSTKKDVHYSVQAHKPCCPSGRIVTQSAARLGNNPRPPLSAKAVSSGLLSKPVFAPCSTADHSRLVITGLKKATF
ncbi:MAG: hypothetical protein IJS90_00330, partial [Clostridia bacterium]|nr:hypothetical protein [Clostridia bacterium]